MSGISIRPLREEDLPAADRIFRLAFGTFLGVPDPVNLWAGREFIRPRWRAEPEACFVAETNREIAGSNLATRWGSLAFFGPLTVHPDSWDKGVGKRLLEPVMELFDRWQVRQAGLFTFPHSAKHINLYQKFGFWPRFLTAIMTKPVSPAAPLNPEMKLSALSEGDQARCLDACRALTQSLLEGLDLEREIRAVHTFQLGETVLLWEGSKLVGFAVCHLGRGTEGGEGTCYVKFGAVLPGPGAEGNFEKLLQACESLAAEKGLQVLEAGVNLGREEAYRKMKDFGFRTHIQGVAMHRPNDPAYNRPGVFLIDDWR